MTVLRVTAAAKRFGGNAALRDAAIELRAGECLGLLGPNGAGKTTLIRAISGRVRLDAGTITTIPRDGAPPPQLGIVPQEIALYPLLTARENLRAFGRFAGVAHSVLDERVDWALRWTNLLDRCDEPIRRYSGGMKRRLNIACGVLHKPQIVLLDEPTVGVDPQSRARIWEMCRELRADGAALLLTTHQLDEAQQICDRIAIIDHGATIACGTLGELVAQTIGTDRVVTLRLAGAAAELPGATIADDGRTATATMRDVAAELSALLASAQAANVAVEDVHIEAPSLQAVFLHLTGRELRE